MVELSTGVKLRVKALSPFVIQKIKDHMEAERPKVPTKFIEEDNRTIEIPEDPAYLEAMDKFSDRRTEAVMNAAMLLGTELESVPDGFDGPSDNGWSQRLAILGFDPPANDSERYLQWVKYMAAPTTSDIEKINEAIFALIGVSEAEVAAAAASFRGRA
jgi:hypothetical protein